MSDLARAEKILRGYPLSLRILAAIEAGRDGEEYERIRRNVEAVEAAVGALSDGDRAIVAMLWFGEHRGRIERASIVLGSERTCWRFRKRLLQRLETSLSAADSVLIK